MHWLLIERKIKKDKLEASGTCAIKQLFLKFRKLPKIWLQQSLFTFTTPVVKELLYNSFWIIIFDIQRTYFREYFLSWFSTEAFAKRCSVKKMLLQILQNSKENTCTRVSFIINSFFKKTKTDSGTGVFLWILGNLYKHFFCRTPPVAASISTSYWSHF